MHVNNRSLNSFSLSFLSSNLRDLIFGNRRDVWRAETLERFLDSSSLSILIHVYLSIILFFHESGHNRWCILIFYFMTEKISPALDSFPYILTFFLLQMIWKWKIRDDSYDSRHVDSLVLSFRTSLFSTSFSGQSFMNQQYPRGSQRRFHEQEERASIHTEKERCSGSYCQAVGFIPLVHQ